MLMKLSLYWFNAFEVSETKDSEKKISPLMQCTKELDGMNIYLDGMNIIHNFCVSKGF